MVVAAHMPSAQKGLWLLQGPDALEQLLLGSYKNVLNPGTWAPDGDEVPGPPCQMF